MARPTKRRLVEFMPEVTYFKPAGVPMSMLGEVTLGLDELEALRLKDLEGLEQEECARKMDLSQSTFQRILAGAREKLTRGIVEGKAIRIEGGHYEFVGKGLMCPECGFRLSRMRRGDPGEPANCPHCGEEGLRPFPGRHGRRWSGR